MYNKLFTKILDSSIWLEPTSTRIVWLTFIATMDEDGFVLFASIANLAHRARVELAEAEAAVKVLESPDANSSDPDHDGRRVERVPGGWLVLNAAKYRELVTRSMIREGTRERVARFRAKKVGNADVTPVTKCNALVTPSEAVSGSGAENKRRGVSPKTPARVPTDSEKAENLLVREFSDGWVKNFEETFGYRYQFQNAKDALACKRLIKTGLSVDFLLDVARRAWQLGSDRNSFEKKNAMLISSFSSQFGKIQATVGLAGGQTVTRHKPTQTPSQSIAAFKS